MNQAFPAVTATQVLLPGFVIDLAREELRTTKGEHVDLRPRSFAVLRLLAAHVGRLVTKEEIMDQVWEDAAVTEDLLTQCIADIRRAIGDEERRIVRTVPRRGYLLVPVTTHGEPAAMAVATPGISPPPARCPTRSPSSRSGGSRGSIASAGSAAVGGRCGFGGAVLWARQDTRRASAGGATRTLGCRHAVHRDGQFACQHAGRRNRG